VTEARGVARELLVLLCIELLSDLAAGLVGCARRSSLPTDPLRSDGADAWEPEVRLTAIPRRQVAEPIASVGSTCPADLLPIDRGPAPALCNSTLLARDMRCLVRGLDDPRELSSERSTSEHSAERDLAR